MKKPRLISKTILALIVTVSALSLGGHAYAAQASNKPVAPPATHNTEPIVRVLSIGAVLASRALVIAVGTSTVTVETDMPGVGTTTWTLGNKDSKIHVGDNVRFSGMLSPALRIENLKGLRTDKNFSLLSTASSFSLPYAGITNLGPARMQVNLVHKRPRINTATTTPPILGRLRIGIGVTTTSPKFATTTRH